MYSTIRLICLVGRIYVMRVVISISVHFGHPSRCTRGTIPKDEWKIDRLRTDIKVTSSKYWEKLLETRENTRDLTACQPQLLKSRLHYSEPWDSCLYNLAWPRGSLLVTLALGSGDLGWEAVVGWMNVWFVCLCLCVWSWSCERSLLQQRSLVSHIPFPLLLIFMWWRLE